MTHLDIQAAATNFIPQLQARADEIESNRFLPQDLAQSFAEAGLYASLMPQIYGGLELPPMDALRLFETLAQGDASAAWCVMIGATSGMMVAWMPPEAACEVCGMKTPDALLPSVESLPVLAGVFAPMGSAIPEGDGFRVQGRWSWGSGSRNAHWIAGGCMVMRDGEPERMANGLPLSRMMMAPAGEVNLLDTWHVSGLCGTGSTDFVMEDCFIPQDRAISLVTGKPLDRPVYKFSIFSFLAVAVSSVCFGIARGALDDLIVLAAEKRSQGAVKPLALREATQTDVARSEAVVRSARAFLYESVERAWESVNKNGYVSVEERRDMRLAAAYGAQACVDVVDIAYRLGGGSSIFRTSPLQRRFRDIHVATQHMMVGSNNLTQMGRLFLNVETDTTMF
ncbi:MAG: acyl-CoA dehydrogenase family protein [Parvularculales bacterium]